MNEKRLAIIVLNYNDGDTTINYVNSIKDYKSIDKIIVVDNNSTDDSFEKMKSLECKKIDVIKSDDNKGYAYGNNYGYRYLKEKYGKYDYICISNPDVFVENSAIKKCIDFLDKNKDYAACAPRMYDRNDEPHRLSGWKERTLKNDIRDSSNSLTKITNKSHEEMYPEDYFDYKPHRDVEALAGSFFIIRSDVFEKVGLFDENTFLYYEEDILAKRIRNKGFKLAVLTDIKFKHMEAVTVSKNITKDRKFMIMQTSKKYYHKNYNPTASSLGLLGLDLVTTFKSLDKPFSKIIDRFIYIKQLGIINIILKFIVLFLTFIFLPITTLLRKLRRKEKVLYFSLIDWKWIKQRPHFVASYLADSGYKVTYLYQKQINSENKNNVKNKINNKNLKIKPYKIFDPSKKVGLVIDCWMSIFKCFFWNYDKIIITHANQTNFIFFKILKLRGIDIYYECMDNYIEWEDNKNAFLARELNLMKYTSHVFVSSQKLYNKFISRYSLAEDRITLVRNGYNKDLFNNYEHKDANFASPNMVYIGTVDSWFDFDTIISFAKKHPEFSIYIIGPVNDSIKLPKQKNIIFVGPIEHKYVPSYIEQSDILLLPFKINDVIEYVDPVKMYEYLYLKKPVISSYWNELSQFEGLVSFYSNEEEFEKAALKAEEDKFKITKNYEKLMIESSWTNRLEKYKKVLSKKINHPIVKNSIITLLLGLLIFSQFCFIYKDNFSGYIFNLKHNSDRLDVNTLVLSKELEITKDIIPRDDSVDLAFTVANKDNEIDVPLQYYYNEMLFYPNKLVSAYRDNDAKYYKKTDVAKKYLDENEVDYLIIVGKNINYYTQTTSRDITVFSYQNQILKKEFDFDMDLYSFKKIAKEYNKEELFDETLKLIIEYIDNYSTTYNSVGVDYLMEYADKLYSENNYAESEKYYKLLAEKKIGKPMIYYNYSKVLLKEKKYSEAYKNIDYCMKLKKCPQDASVIKDNIKEELK